MTSRTLCDCALDVLTCSDPMEKARRTHRHVARWREAPDAPVGLCTTVPAQPARPEKPELRLPKNMPKRGKAGAPETKIALLHALAHIELNAIDLAWDIMARFSALAAENVAAPDAFSLPRAFFDDWCAVADDEAKHFLMLGDRLAGLGAAYGDLPAHNGLWEASERTAHDFAARLAVVPMVLEARGLDVTPSMIHSMRSMRDPQTADMLQIIHDDEITHVRAGTVWFDAWCAHQGIDSESHWQALVREYFGAPLKRPFNDPSRERAGLLRHWYEPLAESA